MFAQSFGRQENFGHYAPDELAVLREEKLNELQTAQRKTSRNAIRSGSIRHPRDLEDEINLIDEELSSRKPRRYFVSAHRSYHQ